MRTNMTEVISEKLKLTKLKEEYETVMQQIAILQQDNTSIKNILKEFEANESYDIVEELNSEENSIIANL